MVGPVFCSDSNAVHSRTVRMGSHYTYLNPYDIKILLCTSQPKTHFALAWKRAVKSKIEAHFPFLVTTTYIRTIGFRSCDFQFILD